LDHLCVPCAKRHVRQNYHVVRELIEDGEAVMEKIETAEQTADALTKALGSVAFGKHRDTMTSHVAPLVTTAKKAPTSKVQFMNRVESVLYPMHIIPEEVEQYEPAREHVDTLQSRNRFN